MKSNKKILNELPVKQEWHLLSDDELSRLQKVLLGMYKDMEAVCEKHSLSIAMAAGNAIGAVRHKGFIPWDDDVDMIMSRSDYEVFRQVFDSELGDKYVLNAPNLSEKPTNRFVKILMKNTRFVELDMEDDERACIKLDLFILENIPTNKLVFYTKGAFCNLLMFIASVVDIYEHRKPANESSMAGTEEGMKRYRQMVFLGRLFSFRSSYRWFDSVDRHCRYHKQTGIIGAPTGTKHYFSPTNMPKDWVYPFRKVPYEDTTVYIPNQIDRYLTQIVGNYMQVPPVEEREHHYVTRIQFPD